MTKHPFRAARPAVGGSLPLLSRLAFAGLVALIAAAIPSPGFAQARLEIRVEGAAPLVLTAADLARMPRTDVRADDHGKKAKFAGVRLADVLRRAGVAIDSVRGRRAAFVVLAIATDGYRAAFSLAEVAPDLGGRDVLIADTRDGAALGETEGPFRLVVPGDRRPTRWVRQVGTIIVFPAREPSASPDGGPSPAKP